MNGCGKQRPLWTKIVGSCPMKGRNESQPRLPRIGTSWGQLGLIWKVDEVLETEGQGSVWERGHLTIVKSLWKVK